MKKQTWINVVLVAMCLIAGGWLNNPIDEDHTGRQNFRAEKGGILFDGTAITATAAELNIMDGVTATAAEINQLDSSTIGVGTVSNRTGLAGVEYAQGNLHQVTLTFTAVELVTSDEAGVTGHGGIDVYTYPAGLIANMGAVIDGALTGAGAAYMLTNWVGDVALGTTEVDNTTTPMVTTQQDILQNTAVAAATALVGTADAVSIATILTESGARWLDGTTAAKKMWLNFLIDEDNANEDNATNTFTGTIEFTYLVIGDN